MPTRAPRFCTKPGCGEWAEREGRCSEHSLSRSGQHSQSTTARGLGHAWRQLVRRAIKDQPWCTDCGLVGDPHTGETRDPDNPLTGDHIVPRSVAPHRALDPTNVDVRCLSCNDRKGTRGGRAGAISPGRGP